MPDASVIWQNRVRCFNGTDIPRTCEWENTLQRQHKSIGKRQQEQIQRKSFKKAQSYIDDLNKAINDDRAVHGKKPLKFDKDKPIEPDDEDNEDYFEYDKGSGS